MGDADFYDNSGALLLPVERMRRWLTPADINGTGSVTTWNLGANPVSRGADHHGRVEYYSYFRPPGSPGQLVSDPAPVGYRWGAVTVNFNNWATGSNYVPDVTNNATHGFESFRFPNQNYSSNGFTPQRLGGMPVNLNLDANNVMPVAFPTYDFQVNAAVRSDGLNEADEMNLYAYNALLDSPYGPSDLEWLYRQQDVNGASLTSRLKQLAPISLTNGIDGQRRRRLFALDTFESNGFVWAFDNPSNTFSSGATVNTNFYNGTTTPPQTANPTFQYLGLPTPALAHRNRKINLNYPLPVSNDPNEPIRQKWISDAYQLLKAVLPPRAVDAPEELAQLSQYLINVIDFRDPDNAMTHWVNPDVMLTAPPPGVPNATTPPATLLPASFAPVGSIQLDQYGMEFCPVAINEALAYTFRYMAGAARRWLGQPVPPGVPVYDRAGEYPDDAGNPVFGDRGVSERRCVRSGRIPVHAG